MCDRAGADALWIGDQRDDRNRLEAWTALVLAGLEASRARIGALLDVTRRPAALVSAMAATLDAAVNGRLEIALRAEGSARAPGVEEYVRAIRERVPIAVEVVDPQAIDPAVRVADDVVLPGGTVEDIRAAIDRVRARCEGAGRDPRSLGLAVEVPVSIGRTSTEARARASAEPLFQEIGDPAMVGLFGTLEQCQDRVIALAHLGITDLRCILPNTPDVHDAIAQLTAAVVGSVDVLTPEAPRSRPPDPPEGWGGRSRIG